MPDLRELFDSGPEEAFRASFAGLQKHLHTSMVSEVTENSDGKTVVAQPTIMQQVIDPTLTQTTYEGFPILPDVPVHFPGGAGVTLTHGIAKGDEILTIFAGRAHDWWFQNGGQQQPVTDRTHSMADGIAIPGLRSMPRELKQISTATAQLRDDAKHHVVDHDPAAGHTVKSVDPSTAPASDSFDPFTQATKFYQHLVQGASGVIGQATDGNTTHDHGVTHDNGAFMRVANALHEVLCHPTNGAAMMALNGLHKVLAHPSIGAALMSGGGLSSVIATATGVAITAPPGGLSLPSGGVSGGALASGAAASNVGTLSGDLAGTLPSPQVVGLGNVDAHLLPTATSDAAAAALTPPVPIGGLYRDTSIASGKSVLVVRTA